MNNKCVKILLPMLLIYVVFYDIRRELDAESSA